MWLILGAVALVDFAVTMLAVMNAWKSRALFSFFSVFFGLATVGVFALALNFEIAWMKAQSSAFYVGKTIGVEVHPEVLFYHTSVFDRVLEQRLKDIMNQEVKQK